MGTRRKKMARPSPTRRPRPGLRGVSPIWSGGKWKFRAFVRRRGRARAGPLRETAIEAQQDYLDMGQRWDEELRQGEPDRRSPPIHGTMPRATIRQALDLAIERAKARGVTDLYVVHQLTPTARFLVAHLDPSKPIARLSVDDVIDYVRRVRGPRRGDNTIRDKDLMLLDMAARAAGVPSPVPAAKEQMTTLRRRKHTSTVVPIEEFRELIGRIRASDPVQFPAAQHHADIFELVAYTGIRAGELARLRAKDIDVKRCEISVQQAKNRARPRIIPLPRRLAPVLERLRDAALAGAVERGDTEDLLVPGGMPTLSTLCSVWKRRLGDPRLNLRHIRHAVASALARGGVAIVDVSHVLGHTNTSTTDRYLHSLLEGERMREAMGVLEDSGHSSIVTRPASISARKKARRKPA